MKIACLLLFAHVLALPPGPGVLIACNTTQGSFKLEIISQWAPIGAARFLSMVSAGFFNTRVALFRVVPNFLVQFGVAGDPTVTKEWDEKPVLQDDRNVLGNDPFRRGMISFAGSGPNSRTTQMFIAFGDSTYLGHSPWETPFGRVIEGMDVIDRFYSGYGDLSVFGGKAPSSAEIERNGATWVSERFPKMDFIESCAVAEQPVDRSNSFARKFTIAVEIVAFIVIVIAVVCLVVGRGKKVRTR